MSLYGQLSSSLFSSLFFSSSFLFSTFFYLLFPLFLSLLFILFLLSFSLLASLLFSSSIFSFHLFAFLFFYPLKSSYFFSFNISSIFLVPLIFCCSCPLLSFPHFCYHFYSIIVSSSHRPKKSCFQKFLLAVSFLTSSLSPQEPWS